MEHKKISIVWYKEKSYADYHTQNINLLHFLAVLDKTTT